MKILLATLLLLIGVSCHAEIVPLILPVSPGGLVHRYANELQPGLSAALGATIVQEFKPGGDGQVGAKYLAEKTGIALMIGSAHAWTDFSQLHDLIPIAFLGTSPAIIIARPNEHFQNYKEFLEYSKTHATSYGIIPSSANVQLFRNLHAKVKSTTAEIPYKAGSQVIADVLGGHVDVGVTALDAVIPLINQGKLIALAVVSAYGSDLLPDVPTLIRLGLATKNEAKYYNNIFLWVNKSADPVRVEKFKQKLFKFLQSTEADDIRQKLDFQYGSKDFRDAYNILMSIVED